MAIKAVSRKPFEVTVEPDEVQDKTIFIMVCLDGADFLEAQKMFPTDKQEILDNPKVFRDIDSVLAKALVGWKNFLNPETGEHIEFPEDVSEAVKMIPFGIKATLLRRVANESIASMGLRKNL